MNKNRDHRNKPVEKAADFLPHPETLEAYNYVIEGSAERIIKMIEREQAHRHNLEAKAISVQQSGFYFGQFLAAVVSICVVGLVAVLAMQNKDELAAFFGVVGLACMTVAFVKGRQAVASQGRRMHSRNRPNPPYGKINPSENRNRVEGRL